MYYSDIYMYVYTCVYIYRVNHAIGTGNTSYTVMQNLNEYHSVFFLRTHFFSKM